MPEPSLNTQPAATGRASRWPVLACGAVWLAYVLVRILAIPSDALVSGGFCHDCAYLANVAGNLHAGKGYVLDALWLVYLQPASLPMAYHNGAPLFPTLVAGLMAPLGVGGVKAGLLVAALSSPALILALLFLVRRWVSSFPAAFGIACAVALFPPVWDLSWVAITDELWIALLIAFLAALVRSERLSMAAWAGVFLGLAWLTRIAAISLVPGLGLWLLLTFGWRRAIPRGILIGVLAAVVSLPWMIHTYKVWGDPLRSDTPTITASHIRAWDLPDQEVVRVWHMPDAPAPASVVFRRDPVRYVKHYLMRLPASVRELIRSTTDSNYLALACLALLMAAAIRLRGLSPWNPALLAILLYTGVFTFFLSVDKYPPDGRYFVLVHALAAVWLAVSVYEVARGWAKGRAGLLPMAALGLAALYLGVGLLPSDIRIVRSRRGVDPYLDRYTKAARAANSQIAHGAPVVVGYHPYLYTMATGAQALAIPEADDGYLRSYMARYHAQAVLLSDEERAFWRPAWETQAGVPTWLHPLGEVDGYWRYRLEDSGSR